MSLLLDENLSPRLVARLGDLFPGLTHVSLVGLKQANDRTIWEWARASRYAVVTADADFVAMARTAGTPPKLVHIERCDFPLRVIEDLLRRNAIRIAEFLKNPESRVLALRFPA